MEKDIREGLKLNNKGNVVCSEDNVMLIMKKIIENAITNERNFVSTDIGMLHTSFNKKLAIIKEKYPEFYKQYETILNQNIEEKKEEIKVMLYYINSLMKYGIELEDGTFRKFDIFDFHILKKKFFDNLNRTEISLIFDEVIKESTIYNNINIIDLRIMLSQSFNNTPRCFGINSLQITKNSILNNLNIITKEEAEFLVEFFEEYNIQFNEGNYYLFTKKLLEQRKTNNDLFKLEIPLVKNKALIK